MILPGTQGRFFQLHFFKNDETMADHGLQVLTWETGRGGTTHPVYMLLPCYFWHIFGLKESFWVREATVALLSVENGK